MVYYIMYQGQVTGPMSREQMSAYGVNRDTMVSANGGDWKPLYMYPELMEMIAESRPSGNPMGGYQRQVGFGEAISRCFRKYACFSGRASRSEFWWWMLFTYIVSIAVSLLSQGAFASEFAAMTQAAQSGDPELLMANIPWGYYSLSGLVQLILFLPSLGVTVRRLHDTGRSGWWVLLNAICCVGGIILLVWYCQASEETENEYGPVPNVE